MHWSTNSYSSETQVSASVKWALNRLISRSEFVVKWIDCAKHLRDELWVFVFTPWKLNLLNSTCVFPFLTTQTISCQKLTMSNHPCGVILAKIKSFFGRCFKKKVDGEQITTSSSQSFWLHGFISTIMSHYDGNFLKEIEVFHHTFCILIRTIMKLEYF